MARSTVYNNITSPEKLEKINSENKTLTEDFLNYLESIGRSPATIKNYRADLSIFFCWVQEELDNKSFISVSKRDIIKFQNQATKVWGWSPNRLRTVKAAIASLGNFVENILDDEYEGFKSVVRKVESPPIAVVREKTVWSDEELESLLEKLVNNGEYDKACYIALAMYSGRRKSELCRFRVSDFDESHLICDGALYKSSPIKTKGRGGGKYIACYTLAKKFKPYFDLWMNEREKQGIVSEWLFPSKADYNNQLSTSTVDSWTNRLSKLSGKDLYIHSLRHYFTSALARAGMPDSAIQTLVAWESADMVRLYDDTPKDDQIAMFFKDGDICVKEQKSLSDL